MKKQETFEEAAQLYSKQFDYAEDSSPQIDFIEGARWQAKQDIEEIAMYQLAIERQEARCKVMKDIINDLQSRMFNEEEVLQIVGDCDGCVTQAKRTLEQFKKK